MSKNTENMYVKTHEELNTAKLAPADVFGIPAYLTIGMIR